MPHTAGTREAVEANAVRALSSYIRSGRTRTDYLKEAAEEIAHLRAFFTLDNGLTDWGGRSTAYRATIHEIYSKARVSKDDLDTVQSALRYHVGNRLRETVDAAELEAAGMTQASPKARKAKNREIVAALSAAGTVGAVANDPVRRAVYADVLLESIDEDLLAGLSRKDKVAARHALQAIEGRLAGLLSRVGAKPRKV